jgi:hypothetical protein
VTSILTKFFKQAEAELDTEEREAREREIAARAQRHARHDARKQAAAAREAEKREYFKTRAAEARKAWDEAGFPKAVRDRLQPEINYELLKLYEGGWIAYKALPAEWHLNWRVVERLHELAGGLASARANASGVALARFDVVAVDPTPAELRKLAKRG